MSIEVRSDPQPRRTASQSADSSRLAAEADAPLAPRDGIAHQPGLGLRGLLLVIPVALLLAFAVNGAQGSTIVLGPLAVFALAPIAMIAFWWENWPGTRFRPSWSGWADTLLIIAIAVSLTVFSQLLVGHLDPRGIFFSSPGPDHSPVFPITLPLAGAAFVAIMQLTFVCERWPLQRLTRTIGGFLALAAAWLVALALFLGLVAFHPPPDSGLRGLNGPFPPAELGALLVITGLWQVWIYIAWEGWPLTRITSTTGRLLAGNTAVVGAGIATYLLAQAAGLAAVSMIALAGSFIAAALLLGLLFDGWLPGAPKPSLKRLITIILDLALAALLYTLVNAYADHLHWTTGQPVEWVAHVMLNAIALSVILHVPIGRRWPFGRPERPAERRS